MLSRVTRRTAEAFVKEAVSNKVSLIATDEAGAYHGLTKQGFPHSPVHHASKQYVVGAVHTNTIEGFWSLFKRGIVPQGQRKVSAAVRR